MSAASPRASTVGEVVSRSSSAELSSPPHSSREASPSAHLEAGRRSASNTTNPATAPPARKKPGRKPKISLDNAGSATGTDPPRTRKPRKPKDPNAPPRKARKHASSTGEDATLQVKGVAGLSPPDRKSTPKMAESDLSAQDATFDRRPDTFGHPQSQNGKHEDIPQQRQISSFFAPPPLQQPQPQPQPQSQHAAPSQSQANRSSGQNYDPIRSNYDPVRETVLGHHPYNNPQGSPGYAPPSMNRASASPSISSLVDPPNHALTSPSVAAQSFFHQQQQTRYRDDTHPSLPSSPNVNRLAPSAAVESSPNLPFTAIPNPPGYSSTEAPPAIASGVPSQTKKSTAKDAAMLKKANGSASTSSAASPKTLAKGKDKDFFPAPPPLPGAMGGGLNDGTEFRAPTVILNIPLGGESNKYINFTRLAEAQYGWDALHPRLAAQRDRLARVAAAGAAIARNGPKESGDEMSVDSGDEDSNVEMGGMSDGRTGTDKDGAKRVVKKRKMREDEYDKEDGFVDDTELLWEEQAAATNDGFFVYSGPLVPEVKKPAAEPRADGAPKRGRGGGRGSRGGALTRAPRGSLGPRGGGGPGSRGGQTTRKPRITKADRARLELEKQEREKMGAMATMPANYGPGMPQQLAAPTLMGTTPMVFNQ